METKTENREAFEQYPVTSKFKVIDSVGVPHPYCITPKHLRTGRMYLDKEAIIEAESRLGAVCGICKKRNKKFGEPILSYKEHKKALLIEVIGIKDLGSDKDLKIYLLSIKRQTEQDGYVGFAFVKAKN